MFGLKGLKASKLTAVRFPDEPSFRQAARLAAERKVPVDAPGHYTLIVRKSDKKLFKIHPLEFEEEHVADPEEVSGKEPSRLRRFSRP